MSNLDSLVRQAKRETIRYLKNHQMCKRLELDDYVFNRLNMTEKKDGTVLHQTKPIHNLAVILAYKQLEAEGKIKIERPSDVPFPMTDNNTLFSTVNLD